MENSLMHWRTKGSKNGQRLYQEKSGLWTEEGKARRRAMYQKAVKKGKGDKPSPAEKIFRSSSEAINATSRMYRTIKDDTVKKEDLSRYSEEELKKKIARLDLERRYSELNSKNVSDGKDYLMTVLDVVGGLSVIAGSAASIAVAIHEIRG